jgi:hypothetical protein
MPKTTLKLYTKKELHEMGRKLYAPLFPNQLLAVACAARDTTRVEARVNLILSCYAG